MEVRVTGHGFGGAADYTFAVLVPGPWSSGNAAGTATLAQHPHPGPDPCDGNFGLVALHPVRNHSAIDVEYVLEPNGFWAPRVNSYMLAHTFAVCSQGRVVINGPANPPIGPTTFCDIVVDFTPVPGAAGLAPYSAYFAHGCVVTHENTHVFELQGALASVWPTLEMDLETDTRIKDECDDMLYRAEDAKATLFDPRHNSYRDKFSGKVNVKWPGERNATAAENNCLAGLRSAICIHASNSGWPSCASCPP